MDKLNFLRSLPLWIATPVGAGIATWAVALLSDLTSSLTVLAMIFLAFFLISAKILELVITIVIEESTALRRLVMRKDFIEGWWYQDFLKVWRVRGEPTVTGDYYAILSICYDSGSYVVKGYVINPNGEIIGSWSSQFSRYHNGQLEYFFNGPWFGSEPPFTVSGYTRFTFIWDPPTLTPSHFDGQVLEIGPDNIQLYFHGCKVPESLSPDRYSNVEMFAQEVRMMMRHRIDNINLMEEKNESV